MIDKKTIEILAGVFIILGALALFVLALKVSGWTSYSKSQAITISANFDEIGDLKVRAPIKIAGVDVGEVTAIQLDNKEFRAKVFMLIDKKYSIPVDSSASILSVSLLGSKYISIIPGFANDYLKNGEEITETRPAVMLENLIGQAIFTPKDEKK